MEKWTMYLSIPLAFLSAIGQIGLFNQILPGVTVLKEYGWSGSNLLPTLANVLTMIAGTMIAIWLGQIISEYGIQQQGLSLIIFSGIVSNMPASFAQVYNILAGGTTQGELFNGILQFVLYCVLYLFIVIFVIIMETAVRKIPIQYTNSSSIRGGSDITFLPLKINSASVIPVIFAQAIMTAPQIIISFFNTDLYQKLSSILSLNGWFGLSLYALLTILFTFFYTDLQVDPDQVAENLGKSGAYIPGIRPGSETRRYLHKVINRITVLGAAALTIIAVIPYLLPMFTSLPTSTAIGGTGIIIVVGVAMETFNQLKGQLTQKQYHGFLG